MKERKGGHPARTTAAMCRPVAFDPGTLYSDLVRQVKYSIQSYGSNERGPTVTHFKQKL